MFTTESIFVKQVDVLLIIETAIIHRTILQMNNTQNFKFFGIFIIIILEFYTPYKSLNRLTN